MEKNNLDFKDYKSINDFNKRIIKNYNPLKNNQKEINFEKITNFYEARYKDILEITWEEWKTNKRKLEEWLFYEKVYKGLLDVHFDFNHELCFNPSWKERELSERDTEELIEERAGEVLIILSDRRLWNNQEIKDL